jgi:hypothetical protein
LKTTILSIEKLQSDVQKLPVDLQQEVMDFVEFLLSKIERNAARQEEVEWSRVGLAYMMQRMDEEEGDDTPVYTLNDLKQNYQS